MLQGLVAGSLRLRYVVVACRARRPHPGGASRGCSGRAAQSLLLPLFLAACVSTDAHEEYQVAASGIRERTGSPEVWEPEADEARIEQDVDALLAAGPTVEDCVRVALLENPELRAEFTALGMARAEVARAGLLPNPSLAISARVPSGGGRTNLTISVSEALLDLLLRPRREKVANAQLEASRARLVDHAVALAAEVRAAGYRILALREARRLIDGHGELAQRELKLAEDRLAAGYGDAVDVDLARSDVLAVESRRVELDGEVEAARLELRRLLAVGRRGREWTLTDELPALRELPDEEALLTGARSRRPDLAAAQADVQAAEAQLSLESGRAIPPVDIGIERERAESPPNLTGPTASTELPLFDRNGPGIAAARLDLERSRHTLDARVERATAEIRGARNEVNTSLALVQLHSERGVPRAREAVEAASRAYESGRRDLLVLLDAQRRLLEEEEADAAALGRYAAALANLEQAAGGRIESPAP